MVPGGPGGPEGPFPERGCLSILGLLGTLGTGGAGLGALGVGAFAKALALFSICRVAASRLATWEAKIEEVA